MGAKRGLASSRRVKGFEEGSLSILAEQPWMSMGEDRRGGMLRGMMTLIII